MEIIYGKNAVYEALKSNRKAYEIYVKENLKSDNIIELAKKKKIKIISVSKRELDNLVGEKHQGVALKIEGYSYKSVEYILENKKWEYPFIILLDCIEDPHNLGAILRTADAAGVDGVIIPKRNSAGLNSTVAKVSTGAIEYVAVAQVANLNMTIRQLKKNGFLIVGSDASGSKKYNEVNYKCPLALVIGSEGKNIRHLIKESCDILVNIPMTGHVTSLNAAVAAGILMFEVNRQRDL